jgi:PLAT/LH2 domain
MQLAAVVAAVGALLVGVPGTASATSSDSGTYAVVLKTACALEAGTDSDVYIMINGTAGSTPYRRLDNPGNDREVCSLDRYTLSGLPNVGAIRSVDIRLLPEGWGPAWKLQHITVSKFGGTASTTKAVYNKWLDTSKTYHIDLS